MKKCLSALMPILLLTGCVSEQPPAPVSEINSPVKAHAKPKARASHDTAALCRDVGYSWGMVHTSPSNQARVHYAAVLERSKREVAALGLYTDQKCQRVMVMGREAATKENQLYITAVQRQQAAAMTVPITSHAAKKATGPSGSFGAPIKYSQD